LIYFNEAHPLMVIPADYVAETDGKGDDSVYYGDSACS
jgi:hypothetical protein